MAYSINQDCQGCQACVRNCPTQAISGVRREVHEIDSQKCIDCGTCGRVCPYNAVNEPSGTIAQRVKRADWYRPTFDYRTCISCGLCLTICPVSCLDLDDPTARRLTEGLPYLKVPLACVGCGFCESVCSVGAIMLVPRSSVND
ncbi:4Fe-4S binding protein (plasmid) [Chloroflexota bacterium]|nr:4Fe-4S binding protein [Chloroflexota bacterium]